MPPSRRHSRTHWLHPDPIISVQSKVYNHAGRGPGELQQSAWISMESRGGVSVMIRGAAAGFSHRGHEFIIQGDGGTLRGVVDSTAGESLERDDASGCEVVPIEGEWFGDGFVGSMRELLLAVEDRREPLHGLADNFRTIDLVSAVCRSARTDGARIHILHSDEYRALPANGRPGRPSATDSH